MWRVYFFLCVQPGGSLFITTINKTNLSFALGIVVAEQLLRIVPSGTHDWEKFISPVELERLLESSKEPRYYFQRSLIRIHLLYYRSESKCEFSGAASARRLFPSLRWFLGAVCSWNVVQPVIWGLELDQQHRHQLRPPCCQSERWCPAWRARGGGEPQNIHSELSHSWRRSVASSLVQRKELWEVLLAWFVIWIKLLCAVDAKC